MELQRRPAFFTLYRIRFPVTAIVSIGHRVSGVLLALMIPILAWFLQLSIGSRETFDWLVALLDHAIARWAVVLLVWALAHHVFAGVRHLLFDIHLGTSLSAARMSAWIVFALEAVIVLLAIGAIA